MHEPASKHNLCLWFLHLPAPLTLVVAAVAAACQQQWRGCERWDAIMPPSCEIACNEWMDIKEKAAPPRRKAALPSAHSALVSVHVASHVMLQAFWVSFGCTCVPAAAWGFTEPL